MKTIKLITFSLFIPLLFSCREDLMKDIEKGDWNNERGILNIKFEYQIGDCTIKRDSDNNGVISFMFNESAADKARIKLEEIVLSYGATADVSPGDELNFNNPENTASITITSKTGLQRTWKLICLPFVDELVGSWNIITLSAYGGAYPELGGAACHLDIRLKKSRWLENGTGPVAEYDNTLTFIQEGITKEGDTYGTLINEAGPDNKYADFIFIDNTVQQRTPLDVNYLYRKIPEGESKWKRNSQQGTITFTDNKNESTTGYFLNQTVEKLDEYGNNIIIIEKAFEFQYEPVGYTNINTKTERDQLVDNLRKYWIQIVKVE